MGKTRTRTLGPLQVHGGTGAGTVGQGHKGNIEQRDKNIEYWDRDMGDRDVGGPGQGLRRQGE